MKICTQEDIPSKPESGSLEEGRGEGLKLSGSGSQHGYTAGQPGVAEGAPPPIPDTAGCSLGSVQPRV